MKKQFFILMLGLIGYAAIKNEVIAKEVLGDEKIRILEIDTTSSGVYSLIAFERINSIKKGILLVFKTENNNFKVGEILDVSLCDVSEYKKIIEKDSSDSLKFEETKGQINTKTIGDLDTLILRGHFMENGQILMDGKLLLDFSDKAKVPVFKICDK